MGGLWGHTTHQKGVLLTGKGRNRRYIVRKSKGTSIVVKRYEVQQHRQDVATNHVLRHKVHLSQSRKIQNNITQPSKKVVIQSRLGFLYFGKRNTSIARHNTALEGVLKNQSKTNFRKHA